MSAPGGISIDTADGIATLRLVNPSRRNAISGVMWNKIADFAHDVGNLRNVRVVMIRGDGDDIFSAGADISDFATARNGEGNARAYDDLVENTCRAVEAIPQPTIALIFGGCMGAGSSLAASCDMRIAACDAFFVVPAARLGLGYDPRGIARFIRVFGAAATRQILFTADRLSAGRAYDIGAAHFVAPKGGVTGLAIEVAQKISSNAPLTIKAAKAAIRALTTDNPALMAEAERLYVAADASADYAEGRKAFAEKRSPRFTGN
jgi:enoyl-CoA hydratase/carnithine racemase